MAREMKDSGVEWIGEIPAEWEVIKAKYLVQIANGADPKTEGNILVYGSGATSFKTCGEYKEGPAVLLGRKGATLHIPHYIEGKYWNVDTAFDVKANNSKLLLRLFYYLAICFDYKGYISQTTLPGMTQTNYKNIHLPIAPQQEQQRIVEYLDHKCVEINALLEKIRASIEEYKKLKQAIITRAVTKGVRDDRPMKDSEIEWVEEMPSEWEKDKVFRLFKTIGSGTTPKFFDEGVSDGDIHWIQSGDITDDSVSTSKNLISMSIIEKYSTLKIYTPPFIIIAMYGASIGNLAISQILGCVNQACCVLKSGFVDLQFAFYCFRAAKNYLIRKGIGGGQPNISQETIKQLWLPIPPQKEQIEITNYLDEICSKIDQVVKNEQELIHNLEFYKKSFIYEYVTGKKSVKEN